MSNLTVVPLPDGATGKQHVIERLEALLEQARKGEIIGIIYVTELVGQFEYGKCNVTWPHAIAMLERAKHNLNLDWDAYK